MFYYKDRNLRRGGRMEKEAFIEALAAYEHKRWSKWQSYLHSICIENEDGSLTIPLEKVNRWEGQIKTDYQNLSEEESRIEK